MLNSSVRREALENLKRSIETHSEEREDATRASAELLSQRRRAASEVINRVEKYVNTLANSPKEFDKTVEQYRVESGRFESEVQKLEVEEAQATTVGPSAAVAVAMTFGTAPTSTAMLAMPNPVGWAFAAVALGVSAAYQRSKNRKQAEEATQQRVEVEAKIRSLRAAKTEIARLRASVIRHADGCLGDLDWLEKHAPQDYERFGKVEKERLAALINHIRSLGKLLV